MTAVEQVRAGGREVWSPSVTPPIGVELTMQQQLACSFRILARSGFSENIAGHITADYGQDGSMWVNPWGLWWDEVKASDLCRVDADGKVLEGTWDVTPAIHIHTELHRRRPDARVVTPVVVSRSGPTTPACTPICRHSLTALRRSGPRRAPLA